MICKGVKRAVGTQPSQDGHCATRKLARPQIPSQTRKQTSTCLAQSGRTSDNGLVYCSKGSYIALQGLTRKTRGDKVGSLDGGGAHRQALPQTNTYDLNLQCTIANTSIVSFAIYMIDTWFVSVCFCGLGVCSVSTLCCQGQRMVESHKGHESNWSSLTSCASSCRPACASIILAQNASSIRLRAELLCAIAH